MRPDSFRSAANQLLACAAAATISLTPTVQPALAATPTAEAQASLRKAFTAAQAGLGSADDLLSSSISEWEKSRQPSEEIAALYKARGGVRAEQGDLSGAREDLTRALTLVQGSKTSLTEVQRTYQLRARVNGQLSNRKEQVSDLTSAIDLLDQMDIIEATNPYLYAERSRARMAIGEFKGAAEDSETAEVLFQDTGDKIRRTLAAADGALASYGAGETADGIEKLRFVFRAKRTLASTNPDDIALLQELTRRDAELHIAYAAHLHSIAREADATKQWESGCVRLETYVVDGKRRFDEEAAARERDAALSEAVGKAEVERASSVRTPLGDLTQYAAEDFRVRLNGMDPKSPVVTQRAAQSYFWYKTNEGDVERRDAGNPIKDRADEMAIGLSCTAFRDPAWVARYRPEWPANLATRMQEYAADVQQPIIPLPPKGAPPTRGELEF